MKLPLAALLAASALLPGGARAQEPQSQPKEPARRRVAQPLKLEVLFQRFQGDKKVASLPYTLSLNADERPARLRMGVQVPIAVEEKDARVRYENVGSNLDCQAVALDGGRYAVTCAFEQSSIYAAEGGQPAGLVEGQPLSPPVLRSFRADASLALRDGETEQHTVATDPVSGEQLRISVTLRVPK